MSGLTNAVTMPVEQRGRLQGWRHRLVALDVLRGMAILGTLAANIGIFLVDTDGPRGGGADGAAWKTVVADVSLLVTDGKWIGLLTILFGIGMEIQRQAAYRRGDRWPGGYPVRAAILVLLGLLNYFFLFEYDVLMGYGLTALVVCWVLATSPRVQKWVMGLGILAHVSLLTYEFWRTLTPVETPPEEAAVDRREDVRARMASDVDEGEWGAATTYWGGFQERVDAFFGGGRSEVPTMLVMGLGLFLVAAHLYRAGIFLPEGNRLRWWVMGLAFGVGMPIDFVTRIWFEEQTHMYNRYLTSAMVAFGVLALVGHFYAKGRAPGFVGRAMGRVGKVALTCYIGQNLIASILFKPWALDLSRHFDGFWGPYLAFALVAAILIMWSTVWLRYFERGPVEWVWRWSYEAVMMVLQRVFSVRRAAS